MKLNEMENIGMAAAEAMMIICATVINSVEISSIFFNLKGTASSNRNQKSNTNNNNNKIHNNNRPQFKLTRTHTDARRIDRIIDKLARTLAHSQLNAHATPTHP